MTSVNDRATMGSGSTISPIPRTRARPPIMQNGMSAPSRLAAEPIGRCEAGPPQRRRGVGRSAAEPAAVRDPLVDRARAALCPARRGRVRRGSCRRVGMPVGERTGRRERRRRSRVDREHVVELEADHLGVDQVVAVVAHAGDAQRQRQLGRGPATSSMRCQLGRATASASRHQASTSSSSGRAVGATPAASNCSGVTRSASDRRSILRRWPKPVAHQWEQRSRVGRRAVVRRVDLDERRLDVRVAARTPSPARGRRSAPSPSTPPSRSRRRRPACAGRRRSARPTSRCTITSMRWTAGTVVEEVAHERRGDVVRQVGDEHPRRSTSRSSSGRPVDLSSRRLRRR